MKYYYLLLALFLCTHSFSQSSLDTVKKTDFGDTSVPHHTANGIPLDGKDDNSLSDSTSKATDKNTSIESILKPLINYNFIGNGKGFSNLTPSVDYGYDISRSFGKKKKNAWVLSINPYVAGQINIKDSSSYVPALMLPGNAGIRINSFFEFGVGSYGTFTFSPINFAIKFMPSFADSSAVLIQHNLRSMIGFKYSDLFIIAAQYSYGWHNSTSESFERFKHIFNKSASDIQYLTVSLQTKIVDPKPSSETSSSKEPTYLFVEWRNLLAAKKWDNLPNQRFFTIGIRKDISFDRAAPARAARRTLKKGK